MKLKTFLTAAAIFSSIAPALRAQDASVLGAGTRVKLITPALDPSQQTGKVIAATHDTITFRSDANPVTRSFAVADLTGIEVSGGKDTHRGRDALYGLVIGGAAGAAIGAASYKTPKDCFIFCETRRGDAVAGSLFFGTVGTLVGAFIVGSHDKTERWVPLRKTASFRITPASGGVALAMSAHF